MTAPTRRTTAATVPHAPRIASAHRGRAGTGAFPRHTATAATGDGPWHRAAEIRQEWLDVGLSTDPADRDTAERVLTSLYARLRRPRPRFVWVDSPAAALGLITGVPTLEQLYQRLRDLRPAGPEPLASDVAALVSRIRSQLDDGILDAGSPRAANPDVPAVAGDQRHAPEPAGGAWPKSGSKSGRKPKPKPWPMLSPVPALAAGVPLGVVLHRALHAGTHRSLMRGVALPVRAALTGGTSVPVSWYGQQEAWWIGYYDALQRLGLARYSPAAATGLAEWAALARSCGWWWPGDQVCVVTERPSRIRTEPVPGALQDELWLAPDGIGYRDGWQPRLSRPQPPLR